MTHLRPALAALVAVAAAALVAGCGMNSAPAPKANPGPASGSTLVSDTFDGPDRLLTNEYAYWNPSAPDAVPSPTWEMTSGSLFARGGAAWSGAPDDRNPDARSVTGTDSAIFRLTTKRSDLGDVGVDLDLRLDGLTQTTKTPAVDWDGVHVFLRYQSEESLYYASIDRRDGTTAIKKKVPGGPSNGGTYYQLAGGRHAVTLHAWDHVRATVANDADGSVTIRLYAGGVQLASAVDRGTGGPPITHAGKVGLRGDNADFSFDAFKVTAL